MKLIALIAPPALALLFAGSISAEKSRQLNMAHQAALAAVDGIIEGLETSDLPVCMPKENIIELLHLIRDDTRRKFEKEEQSK